jgi:hypothetical protein
MKFELCRILTKPAALHDTCPALIAELLVRHASGDWGDLCAFDRQFPSSTGAIARCFAC